MSSSFFLELWIIQLLIWICAVSDNTFVDSAISLKSRFWISCLSDSTEVDFLTALEVSQQSPQCSLWISSVFDSAYIEQAVSLMALMVHQQSVRLYFYIDKKLLLTNVVLSWKRIKNRWSQRQCWCWISGLSDNADWESVVSWIMIQIGQCWFKSWIKSLLSSLKKHFNMTYIK
jgi:hypothetical protein